MDLEERIMELSRYGYACGQILAILLLETIEEENPALVRCMQGLNGGIGSSGDVCGCMAAGCCLISYFTGKPGDTEYDSPHHKGAIGEFTQWFHDEMKLEYMSYDCSGIVGTNPAKRCSIAPPSLPPPMKSVWRSWKAEVCCKWKSEKPCPSALPKFRQKSSRG